MAPSRDLWPRPNRQGSATPEIWRQAEETIDHLIINGLVPASDMTTAGKLRLFTLFVIIRVLDRKLPMQKNFKIFFSYHLQFSGSEFPCDSLYCIRLAVSCRIMGHLDRYVSHTIEKVHF